VLEVSLRKAGYGVASAADADGALALLADGEPDLIIADTRLPDRDGFALVSELRARPRTRHIPLIFLSSDPSVDSRVRGLELGVDDYLTKPVYIREILARVNLVMERKDREGLGRTAKTRFAGSLEDMGLVDLLQTIELSRKSGVLKLSWGPRQGEVYFRDGRVLDAELGELRGELAIYRFMLWREGSFVLEFGDVARDDQLGLSTQGLLMEGVRRLDEYARLKEQLPPLTSVLEVRSGQLAERLAEVPDELNEVLRAFDGQSDITEVLERLGGDDLRTLSAIKKLLAQGFLEALPLAETLDDTQVGTHAETFVGYSPTSVSGPPSEIVTVPSRVVAAPLQATEPIREEGGRASALPSRAHASEAGSGGSGRGPLAVVQLKRVSTLNETSSLRPQAIAEEVAPPDATRGDELSQSPLASEGDEMNQRAKRKSEERTSGNVIPFQLSRSDSAAPKEQLLPEDDARDDAAARSVEQLATRHDDDAASRSAEQLAARHDGAPHDAPHDDDHPEVEAFFAAAAKSIPAAPGEGWSDEEHVEHDPVQHQTRQRGMLWTAGIGGAGLLFIGAVLLYNKVLMPTPAELDQGRVAVSLPQPPVQPVVEPEPAPAAPAPAAVAPAAPTEPEPPVQAPQAAAPQPEPAPSAPPASGYDALLAEARKLGTKRAAEPAYEKAIEANPKGTEALSGLAMVYLNQGRNDEARVRAEQALAQDKKNAEGWIVLGAAQSALGKRAAARDAYTRCAALPATSRFVAECKRMLRQ